MSTVEILQIIQEPLWLIQCEMPVPAGFPSLADGAPVSKIDLNNLLIPRPDCTYLARVQGTSMDGAPSHIADGALMAVDCSLTPEPGDIVVAAIDGEFTVKRLEKRANDYWLIPDNPTHSSIDTSRLGDRFEVWGVVTYVFNKMQRGRHR
jgi:DNA polymerase V